MARPLSVEKRDAILAAATRVIASQGLGASTASVAKEAGIANGSLFTYFPTKADLLNRLYIELKQDMATAGMMGVPTGQGPRDQMRHVWRCWLKWGLIAPEKRKALAHLAVSEDLTAESRRLGAKAMSDIALLLADVLKEGPMCDAPFSFAVAMMSAIGDAALDAAISDPEQAEMYGTLSFEAFWRAIT
ncbi:TetR/AcrR family transcriptional regulator [Salinisphaera sp. RV14]|uniref:TetR/AcrR family transcriptional regulator n=1 Tax=Salinisphaera sp. RV14 TaxID=3454140 RepID=UPI003F87E201